jgi:hypothetical protein
MRRITTALALTATVLFAFFVPAATAAQATPDAHTALHLGNLVMYPVGHGKHRLEPAVTGTWIICNNASPQRCLNNQGGGCSTWVKTVSYPYETYNSDEHITVVAAAGTNGGYMFNWAECGYLNRCIFDRQPALSSGVCDNGSNYDVFNQASNGNGFYFKNWATGLYVYAYDTSGRQDVDASPCNCLEQFFGFWGG